MSVCLPARNEARTIGPILVGADAAARSRGARPDRRGGPLERRDGRDRPGPRRRGALPGRADARAGPVLGKGDAMWRALPVLTGEVICFLDADSEQFGAHFACGVLGPLLCRPEISFVKGFYRRPFRVGETTVPDGGGRVTELTARPLLNLFYPDLAAVRPAAGRGDRSAARAARATALRHRLRRRHRPADRRVLGGRSRCDRAGRPRSAPERPPAAAGPRADGLRGAPGGRRPARARGPAARAAAGHVRRDRDGRAAGAIPEPLERPPLRSLRAAA